MLQTRVTGTRRLSGLAADCQAGSASPAPIRPRTLGASGSAGGSGRTTGGSGVSGGFGNTCGSGVLDGAGGSGGPGSSSGSGGSGGSGALKRCRRRRPVHLGSKLFVGLFCLLGLLRPLPAAPASPAAVPGPAPEGDPPPLIDVYTMGPGDELFSRFGHAAICVTDAQSPLGRCYNYGTADFSTPGPLTWSFVRGRALFWVSVRTLPAMIKSYAAEDRTLWRQRLPLSAEAARALALTLHAADVREATYYRYHHFNDNCTTRVRDLVDRATGGALHRDTAAPGDPPLREYVRRGFAGQPLLLLLTDLLLGRAADRPTTRWQGMFLPEILRSELQTRLGAAPEVVYTRRQPIVIGSSLGGPWLFVPLGTLLLVGVLATRRRPRWGARLVGAGLGLVGLLVTGLAACSALPELHTNEAVLICLPSDLLLLGLSPRRVVAYARLRLCGLLLCAGALATSLFIQPLVPVLLFCALPLAGLAGRGAGR